jgi:flagellum-specific peptidoglycan hydrolase FlgJ
MDKREFINLVRDGAVKGYTVFRILPSLTIAQAILESGWGSSKLSQKANNLFGIKASSSWSGN